MFQLMMKEKQRSSGDGSAAASLPSGAKLVGESPVFTHETVPEALTAQHQTASGRWAILEVLEGGLVFVDLAADRSRSVACGETVLIAPESPHRVEPGDDVRFQLRFYVVESR